MKARQMIIYPPEVAKSFQAARPFTTSGVVSGHAARLLFGQIMVDTEHYSFMVGVRSPKKPKFHSPTKSTRKVSVFFSV
jgi:hypothetical protein